MRQRVSKIQAIFRPYTQFFPFTSQISRFLGLARKLPLSLSARVICFHRFFRRLYQVQGGIPVF